MLFKLGIYFKRLRIYFKRLRITHCQCCDSHAADNITVRPQRENGDRPFPEEVDPEGCFLNCFTA